MMEIKEEEKKKLCNVGCLYYLSHNNSLKFHNSFIHFVEHCPRQDPKSTGDFKPKINKKIQKKCAFLK